MTVRTEPDGQNRFAFDAWVNRRQDSRRQRRCNRGPDARLQRDGADPTATDPTYRMALLREGFQCLLSGDLATGKAILRDFINPILDSPKR